MNQLKSGLIYLIITDHVDPIFSHYAHLGGNGTTVVFLEGIQTDSCCYAQIEVTELLRLWTHRIDSTPSSLATCAP